MADPGYVTRNGKRIDSVVPRDPDGISMLFVAASCSGKLMGREPAAHKPAVR
jgi:hypothetical protein